MRLVLPMSVLEALESRRAAACDEVEREEDAFMLDPGMGPVAYLTRDGRVLYDERSWGGDAVREATDDEAVAAVVVGARNTGIADLLSLLPARPRDGASCPSCRGERWLGSVVVCDRCSGRGWIRAAG